MEVKVCIGSACYVKRSHEVIQKMQVLIEHYQVEKEVELKASFCLGYCTQAVSVEVEGEVFSVSPDQVEAFFTKEVYRRIKNANHEFF